MTYCIVSNIPKSYRSADLRSHFKQYTENGSFVCFHFRHRPEETKVADQPVTQTYCCMIEIQEEQCARFIEAFHHKKWSCSSNKDYYNSSKETASLGVAVIIKTKINDALKKLPELQPPKLMPAGNVGTTTATFFDLVKKCILPPNIIKKLCLEFPRTVKRKQYSAVPPAALYGTARPTSTNKQLPIFQTLHHQPDDPSTSSNETPPATPKPSFWSEADRKDGHDGAEDWDRHETFHNDVGTQGRTKERLYEEDMEIVWDKGSSGLVFYTDGNYWADLEGKDTDGLWADEWDVDMGVYEGHVGDKDANDAEDMRRSEQFEKFGDTDEKIGDFEKHTKGFGSRLMKQQGWNVGKGLGKSREGIPEPVSTEGTQNPKDKTGLGYRGESICDAIRRNHPKPREQPLIGSKFDDVINHRDSYRRSEDPTAMKYRNKR